MKRSFDKILQTAKIVKVSRKNKLHNVDPNVILIALF